MNFTLDDVKKLYDNYDIKKIKGKDAIVNRFNHQQIFDSKLVSNVEFAHSWFLARQVNQSDTLRNEIVAEEEYQRAFDKQAKLIYDYIMFLSVKEMRSNGLFIQSGILAQKVQEKLHFKHVSSTVLGLFATFESELSFKKWIIYETFNKNKAYENAQINR